MKGGPRSPNAAGVFDPPPPDTVRAQGVLSRSSITAFYFLPFYNLLEQSKKSSTASAHPAGPLLVRHPGVVSAAVESLSMSAFDFFVCLSVCRTPAKILEILEETRPAHTAVQTRFEIMGPLRPAKTIVVPC